MALHSSWEGYIKLNLLSIPVKAYSAAVSGKSRISFHQIHKDCGERIRHQKVCPVHGEVKNDEIISGYEYGKGEYVTVEKDELNELRPEDEQAIAIDVFVRPDEVDPLYYSGKSYYLTPDGKVGLKPYAIIVKVMAEQKLEAVARFVMSGRRQLGLLRPVDRVLVMEILSYADEVKKPSAFLDEVPEVELPPKEVELAETLVKATQTDDFDLSSYRDEYEEDLAELIEAKAKGNKLPHARPAEKPNVINLMDALRKSIEQAQHGAQKNHPHKPAKRKKTG